jgi:hypothetical protein
MVNLTSFLLEKRRVGGVYFIDYIRESFVPECHMSHFSYDSFL